MPKFHAPAEQPLDDVSLEIGGKERQVTFDICRQFSKPKA